MKNAQPSANHDELRTRVQFLKGVGPRRAQILERMGLRTAADILFFFPRDYETLSAVSQIESLVDRQSATVVADVCEVSERNSVSGQSIIGALLKQERGYLRLVWFNQPFIKSQLREGMRLMATGVAKRRGLSWEMAHPRIQELKEGEEAPDGQILPVYSLSKGLSQPQMRRVVHLVLERFGKAPNEVLPDAFRESHNLMAIDDALLHIHRPADEEHLKAARRRFVYQELLVLQLALAMRREQRMRNDRAISMEVDARLHARIIRRFPFDLTDGQQAAIQDICNDVAASYPMNRLVQGDVGCGKTMVAIYAMLIAVAHGKQAVLMAPTEVLARQHYDQLVKILANSQTTITLLTGGQSKSQRAEILEQTKSGASQITVGTHALIQKDVEFDQLALVVVDEQHKFGVRQRQMLRQSAEQPHYLVMTATPIPRTMSMSLFGDLEVSTIRELPPGRRSVHTYVGDKDHREQWWKFFRKKLREGRQGYVITPLVEESGEGELASVQASFEALANDELADFAVDLLHGRMTHEQKHDVMYRFATGETQTLVATSVIEVGVDVPNATVMTIESGERFGLSQLHQLRGRVSRGKFDGYVCVFPASGGDETQERLSAFAKTNDGFELAEIDFRQRGPGNLLGTRQHGLPPLRIADLIRDADILMEARQDAAALVEQIHDSEFESLKKMVINRYGEVLELGDVG